MSDKKRFFTEERILSLGGFIILTAAAIISFIVDAETKTLLPYPKILVPIINTSSAIAALVYFIFPQLRLLAYIILIVQGLSTMITGYETLGVFLFTALGIFSFCNGDLRIKFRLKITVYLTLWFISLFGILPFGIARFILAMAESILFITFYFCIYKKLAKLLAPISPVLNSIPYIKINLPEPGKTVYLCDYDLNERQQKFIYDNLKLKSNYHDLSEKYFVSTSTVKKEMVDAFNKIGVTNLEELRLLFMQYDIQLDRTRSRTEDKA
ncbi:MAG: hypothetical protein K6A43_09095 [Treponema sp.]|nr:hypothetical protein [Treponema sp.]